MDVDKGDEDLGSNDNRTESSPTSRLTSQLRKRKRLSAVVDKISHHLTTGTRSKSLDENRDSCSVNEEQDEAAEFHKYTPNRAISSQSASLVTKSSDICNGRPNVILPSVDVVSEVVRVTENPGTQVITLQGDTSRRRRRRFPRRSSCSTSMNEKALEIGSPSPNNTEPMAVMRGDYVVQNVEQNSGHSGEGISVTVGEHGSAKTLSTESSMEEARAMSTTAALRREQWRDSQQQSIEDLQMQTSQRNYLSTRGRTGSSNSSAGSSDVFKFDSFDRDKYLSPQQTMVGVALKDSLVDATTSGCGVIASFSASSGASVTIHPVVQTRSMTDEVSVGLNPGSITSVVAAGSHLGASSDGDIPFSSPASGRSPHSSLSSPQVNADSPRICFSPLRIKDSIEETDEDHNGGRQRQQQIQALKGRHPQQKMATSSTSPTATSHQLHHIFQHQQHINLPKLRVRGCKDEDAVGKISNNQVHDIAKHLGISNNLAPTAPMISRPVSPNPSITPTTPISPSTPRHLKHLPTYLTDFYRRRCLSDTDLSSSWDDLTKSKSGSVAPSSIGPTSDSTLASSVTIGSRSTLPFPPVSSTVSDIPNVPPPSSVQPRPLCSSPAAIKSLSSGGFLSLPARKGGSLESENSGSSTHDIQDSPLDLSVNHGGSNADDHVKGNVGDDMGSFEVRSESPGYGRVSHITQVVSTANCGLKPGVSMDSVIMQLSVGSATPGSSTGRSRGKSLNRSTGRTRGGSGSGSIDRFSLERLDQEDHKVESLPSCNNEVARPCPICGQIFGKHATTYFPYNHY